MKEMNDLDRASYQRRLREQMRAILLSSPVFEDMTVSHFKSMCADVEDCVNKWTGWNKTSSKVV